MKQMFARKGPGFWCYLALVLLILSTFAFGWFLPGSVSKLETWLDEPETPKTYAPPTVDRKLVKPRFSIAKDRLMLDGKSVSGATLREYEYILMPRDQYAEEGSDPEAWFAQQEPRALNKAAPSALGAQVTDALYIRKIDADAEQAGDQPSNWQVIRLKGIDLRTTPSRHFSLFALPQLIDSVEAFSRAPQFQGTNTGALAADELRVLRPMAMLMLALSIASMVLLVAFAVVLIVRPRWRNRVGVPVFVFALASFAFVYVGMFALNEAFIARESDLLHDAQIVWADWTGHLVETSVMPLLAAGLSLVGLYTLLYKDKAKMRFMLRSWQLYALLAPAAVLVAVFSYGPMFGITLAFKEFHLSTTISQMPWLGTYWFQYAFNDPGFWEALRNTVVISLLNLAFGFPAPILFALLLNELRSVLFKRFTQTVSFLPQFLSWVVIGSIFIGFFTLDGPVNQLIRMFGGKEVHFMGESGPFLGVLIFTGIWKGIGYSSIVFLAAITAVDPQLYESAYLDGSTRLKNMWYITLPCISNVIVIMLILRLGSVLEGNFEQIVNMYNENVLSTANTLDIFVWRKTFDPKATARGVMYDYTAAVGLFKSLVGLVFIVGSNMIARRVEGKEAALW